MTKVLLFDKEKVAEMGELKEEMITDPNLLGAEYFQKLAEIVREFKRRGWLTE